jgi:hypothetical protein
MFTTATAASTTPQVPHALTEKLNRKPGRVGMLAFGVVLIFGVIFIGSAMATIGAADGLGLPVSTTHVLSSGVAGTMMANHSGLQWSTVRNLLLAWVLTLPAAMTLSGFLFFAFRKLF